MPANPVGSKPLSATPLFSEKTQQYIVRGVIVLLALAALGGAIYGGINLGTHSFTHLSEVGMWAVTGVSGFVILCLAIGAIIVYKRTKPPQSGVARVSHPRATGVDHPRNASSVANATAGSIGTAKARAITPPIHPTPRDPHTLSHPEFALLSKLLDEKEYLREETTCKLGPTFRFQNWHLTNMPGSMSSGGFPPPGLEHDKLTTKNNDQIEDLIRSLGYRKVSLQSLLMRAESSSSTARLSAADKVNLTLLNDQPVIAKFDRIISRLLLPQDRFSVLVSQLEFGVTEFAILKNDRQGKITLSLCIQRVYSYFESTDTERLEAHFKELEASGLKFMTQRELLDTYRSERV